jgi:hypothetical protein
MLHNWIHFFVNNLSLGFMDQFLARFHYELLFLLMDDWLMDFVDVLLVDYWLMDLMNDRLMMFMEDFLVLLQDDILVMFMNDILMLLFNDSSLNMLLYYRCI